MRLSLSSFPVVVALFGCLIVLLPCISAHESLHDNQVNRLDALKQYAVWGSNNEDNCLYCTVGLTLVENEVKKEEKPIAHVLEALCEKIGGKFGKFCEILIDTVGIDLLELLLKVENPDKICSQFGFCKNCHLSASSSSKLVDRAEGAAHVIGGLLHLARRSKHSINGIFNGYKPDVDLDRDGFSPMHTYRGADWRGRDCDDTSKIIHPHRVDSDRILDHNCNGVYGVSSSSQAYEDLYCALPSGTRGVVTFGDSASSGFHIPPEWIHLDNISSLIHEGLDEFDTPQQSWDTGFIDSIDGESIYLGVRDLDRCAHRQYSNVGKNGATMADLVEQAHVLNSSRIEAPFLGFVAYIGNDVCANGLDQMTTVEDYTRHLYAGLAVLDSVAPKGTKIILMGLVDGRILWDTMHDREHPLGVTYAQFYRFLTCADKNPCQTWLTPDEATRNATTKRAMELSAVLEQAVNDQAGKYQNIELAYEEFPLDEGIEELEKEHKDPSVMIEKVDGFHPSPYGHRIVARIIWRHIVKYNPHFLPPRNPHNSDIEAHFGNQGGY